eukprot:365815-Chlamydomonas_euryale.AAC.5
MRPEDVPCRALGNPSTLERPENVPCLALGNPSTLERPGDLQCHMYVYWATPRRWSALGSAPPHLGASAGVRRGSAQTPSRAAAPAGLRPRSQSPSPPPSAPGDAISTQAGCVYEGRGREWSAGEAGKGSSQSPAPCFAATRAAACDAASLGKVFQTR